MASEENAVGEKGKGKGKEKEQAEDLTTTEASSSTPPATATSPDPEKDASEAPASPPPPPPAKDAEKVASSQPQRPLLQFDPPLLQPLPPPHPHANRNIFPTSYYEARAMDGQIHGQTHGPEKVEFSRNWNITKLVLSTASLVCCVVVVCLGIVIASWGGVFSIQEALFGITTATAGLAIAWTAIDSLVTCLSHERHRVPPGAHVALHLIIWLMGVFSVVVLSIEVEQSGSSSGGGRRYGTYYSSYYQISHIERAMLGFMIIIMILHFFLFVRACVETHQVNTASRIFKNSLIRYVAVHPDGTTGGVVFSGVPPGWFAQPMPNYPVIPPEVAFPARRPKQQQQPQGTGGPAMPPQAVLYGGYYAPAPPAGMQQIDPSVYAQPSAAAALHGYYGPPPAAVAPVQPRRQSSGGSARHSQRMSSGSGSRRASWQNPPSASPPPPPPPSQAPPPAPPADSA